MPDVPKILQTAAEVAEAMAYLHSHDVLHSDLNGNNILLSSGGPDDSPDFTAKVGGPQQCLLGTELCASRSIPYLHL